MTVYNVCNGASDSWRICFGNELGFRWLDPDTPRPNLMSLRRPAVLCLPPRPAQDDFHNKQKPKAMSYIKSKSWRTLDAVLRRTQAPRRCSPLWGVSRTGRWVVWSACRCEGADGKPQLLCPEFIANPENYSASKEPRRKLPSPSPLIASAYQSAGRIFWRALLITGYPT